MRLVVNGSAHDLDVDPRTPLLYVLRNDLGLPGTRFGCGQSQCGACHVLVDGAVYTSCETPLGSIADGEVTTVDVANDPIFDALRRTFVAEQAAQCGYCLSGIIVSAAALISRQPRPTADEVRAALDANLCRCGTHNRIMRAVLRASEELAP
jgi:nicotinate dehydrogenase subunit A